MISLYRFTSHTRSKSRGPPARLLKHLSRAPIIHLRENTRKRRVIPPTRVQQGREIFTFFSPFPSTSKFGVKLRATNGGNGRRMCGALLTDKHFNGGVVVHVCSFSSSFFMSFWERVRFVV